MNAKAYLRSFLQGKASFEQSLVKMILAAVNDNAEISPVQCDFVFDDITASVVAIRAAVLQQAAMVAAARGIATYINSCR